MTGEEFYRLKYPDVKSLTSMDREIICLLNEYEEKLTSDNNDYATALKVWDEFGNKGDGLLDSQFGYWVNQRLNQFKDNLKTVEIYEEGE